MFLIYSGYEGGVNYAFSHRTIGRLLILYGLFTFLCVPAGFLGRTFCAQKLWGYLLVPYRRGGDRLWRNDPGRDLMSLKNNGQSKTRLLSWGLFSFGAFAIGMGLSAYLFPILS